MPSLIWRNQVRKPELLDTVNCLNGYFHSPFDSLLQDANLAAQETCAGTDADSELLAIFRLLTPREWILRPSATHGKSKTLPVSA